VTRKSEKASQQSFAVAARLTVAFPGRLPKATTHEDTPCPPSPYYSSTPRCRFSLPCGTEPPVPRKNLSTQQLCLASPSSSPRVACAHRSASTLELEVSYGFRSRVSPFSSCCWVTALNSQGVGWCGTWRGEQGVSCRVSYWRYAYFLWHLCWKRSETMHVPNISSPSVTFLPSMPSIPFCAFLLVSSSNTYL
jgi:hypothetical protein